MHVALIIDDERLVHEQPMLHRVAADLAERGCKLTAVLPELQDADEEARLDEPRIPAEVHVSVKMKVAPWMRRSRCRALVEDLDAGPPDLVHAVGEDAWTVALDLSRAVDRPATLELWSAAQVRRVPHSRAAAQVAGYIVPTDPIAQELRRRVDPGLVSLVPPGAELPAEPCRPLAARDQSIALAIITSGVDVAGPRAMLSGLSRLVRELPQIQACLELRGPGEHEIWRHASRLDLLGHISTVVDASHHQTLITGCDILVMPEPAGEVRSLILHAMALGMPILAAEDPYLDMVVGGRTAVVVDHADPDEWADNLRKLVADPTLARRIGGAARSLVAERHRPGDQADKLAAAFEQVLSGGAHTFADAGV